METGQLVVEIEKLSVPEKLSLAQDIWDSISRDADSLPMPEWQKLQLEKRYTLYRQGTLQLHDWQDVHDQLRAK